MQTWSFDPDWFDAQLAALPWNLGQQLFAPQALIVVILLVTGVAVLALIVASMSGEALEARDGVRSFSDEASDSGAGWFGSSCAWLCPWQPPQRLAAT